MGAKNSENCLIEFQCVCELNEAILVSKSEFQFSYLTLKRNISKIKFMS